MALAEVVKMQHEWSHGDGDGSLVSRQVAQSPASARRCPSRRVTYTGCLVAGGLVSATPTVRHSKKPSTAIRQRLCGRDSRNDGFSCAVSDLALIRG
ncbi:unannotated protein [freshwater metagenome]|uniref:Unannotated protein n=1 Tax=freshwater metagenome TaxID=449393 RepID=A0A6J7LLT5_9ZZZZ